MQFMSEDEAAAAGLRLVIDMPGIPVHETPAEKAANAVRRVDQLTAWTATVLLDGFNKSLLDQIEDGLGALHVEFDMLAEDLRCQAEVYELANEIPAETADDAAVLADDLAALTEQIIQEGGREYRLASLIDGLGAIRDDFTRLARELRTAERVA